MDEALYDINAAWADTLLSRLRAHGVSELCIAPGSRSAPLALAAGRLAAADPQLRLHTHFDERALAFYALGLCHRSGRACAVITTSGTAVANLHPALTEARHSYLPLIALTADRPPELLGCGANQAIEQNGIFTPQVRASLNLPPPDSRLGPLWLARHIDATLAHALDAAERGPVHINAQFREPLYGGGEAIDEQLWQRPLPSPGTRYARRGASQYPMPPADAGHPRGGERRESFPEGFLAPSMTPQTSTPGDSRHQPAVFRGSPRSSQATPSASALELTPPLLFLAGALDDHQAQAVLECATRAGIPILADISSQLRLLKHPCVYGAGELLLATTCGRESLNQVNQVWQFGARLTGKRTAQWLAYLDAEHYLISPSNDYLDPNWRATPIQSDIAEFCAALQPPAQEPLANLEQAAAQVRKITQPYLDPAQRNARAGSAESAASTGSTSPALDELSACHIIATELPAQMALFPGNSLAIRLFDLLATPRYGNPCITQRGASGIDGLIATAAGCGVDQPAGVTLVLGDLATLHDLNSLALAAATKHPLVIVVLNNDGGGIFDMLPARGQGERHQQLFRMPHGYTFEHAAAQFHLSYRLCQDSDTLRSAYRTACQYHGATLIEVDCPAQTGSDRLSELLRNLEAAPQC